MTSTGEGQPGSQKLHEVGSKAGPHKERFDGWKEIAGYLAVSPRGAQRWAEQLRLPVHRLSVQQSLVAGTRSHRVYAFRSELDEWLNRRERTLLPKKLAYLAVAVLCAGLVIVAVAHFVGESPQPASAGIENYNILRVLDSEGNVLWRKKFDLRPGHKLNLALVGFADLDEDGMGEVVFGASSDPYDHQFKEEVICFDHDGSELWRYRPGVTFRWGNHEYQDDFTLHGLSARGRLRDGRVFVVAVANHVPYFPSLVSILDAAGRLIGEYRHAGYLFSHDVMDCDQDGEDEILLGGINNLHRKACVAVIRPERMNRVSPVPEGYAPGCDTGRELTYLLFPRSQLSDALDEDSRVRMVGRLGKDHIGVELELTDQPHTAERLYELDRDFRLLKMMLPQALLALQAKAELRGWTRQPLDQAERDRLEGIERLVPLESPQSVAGPKKLSPPSE